MRPILILNLYFSKLNELNQCSYLNEYEINSASQSVGCSTGNAKAWLYQRYYFACDFGMNRYKNMYV